MGHFCWYCARERSTAKFTARGHRDHKGEPWGSASVPP